MEISIWPLSAVADQPLPCAPLAVAKNRAGERKGAAQALCEVICREGQSRRSKKDTYHHKRLVSENLEPGVIFFEEIKICLSAGAGTDGGLSPQASGARRHEDGSPEGQDSH